MTAVYHSKQLKLVVWALDRTRDFQVYAPVALPAIYIYDGDLISTQPQIANFHFPDVTDCKMSRLGQRWLQIVVFQSLLCQRLFSNYSFLESVKICYMLTIKRHSTSSVFRTITNNLPVRQPLQMISFFRPILCMCVFGLQCFSEKSQQFS